MPAYRICFQCVCFLFGPKRPLVCGHNGFWVQFDFRRFLAAPVTCFLDTGDPVEVLYDYTTEVPQLQKRTVLWLDLSILRAQAFRASMRAHSLAGLDVCLFMLSTLQCRLDPAMFNIGRAHLSAVLRLCMSAFCTCTCGVRLVFYTPAL